MSGSVEYEGASSRSIEKSVVIEMRVIKSRNFALKMMSFALKMSNFASITKNSNAGGTSNSTNLMVSAMQVSFCIENQRHSSIENDEHSSIEYAAIPLLLKTHNRR